MTVIATTNLTGRTITMEKVGDVPELSHARLADPDTLRIIERLDGAFVRNHGHGHGLNMIWDDARHIAEWEGMRYIGPGREEIRSAREVREGWYVLVGAPLRKRWHRVKAVSEVVNLAKLRTSGQMRSKIRIELDHRLPVTVAPDEQIDCRQPVGY